MSTSAGIGITQADGSVKAIRVNWDGYPGWTGAVLGGWYNTPERVEALLSLGDLSIIGERLVPDPEKEHSKHHPQDNVVLAYHRDCGEEFRPPMVFADRKEYEQNGKARLAADYLYLFEEGKWSVKGIHNTTGWIELTVEICEQN